jgi:acetyl esterase/lipase
MSREQRELVDQLMRGNPFDLGGDVATQRPLLEALLTAHPVAPDVVTTEVVAGDRAAILIEVPPVTSPGLLLFFHGGGFAFGSAASSVGLAADLARAAGMRCLTVEYRLAPEHPYPAAVDDALSAYRSVLADSAGAPIAVAGESAGGNVAAAMLLRARADGLPMPAALVLMSPLADLAASSQTYESRAGRDPKLTQASIRARVKDYAGDARLDDPVLSPSRADLTGFPPTLIQVGTNEVLLGDALQLANRAAHDDVDVTLQVTSGVPHVFQAFAAILDEGIEALQLAGTFLRRHVQQDADMTR